jgi:ligand-binding sensor domain-containing protein
VDRTFARHRESPRNHVRHISVSNVARGERWTCFRRRYWARVVCFLQEGLQWLRQGRGGIVPNGGLNQDVVYSITGAGNELWVGRQRGGLTRLRYGTGRITARTYTVSNGLPENSVYAVHRSRDGSVWAATVNGGLSQFVDGHFKTYSTANGLTVDAFGRLCTDSAGVQYLQQLHTR